MLDAADLRRLLQRGTDIDVVAATEPWARDFGRVLRRKPRVVVRARQEADVRHCLAVAHTAGLRVTFRGAGHSCRGQALSQGGILIENFTETADVELLRDGRVAVSTRSRWREVERALNAAGRAVPVLTDFQDLSVGGTLAVGGHGFHSIARGLQVDHVERARLLLPDGTARWASPTEEPELFRFALAGLGQLAFVERVVLATVERRPFTTLHVATHESLPALAASLAWLLDWRGEWPAQFNAVLYQDQVMAFWGAEHESAEAAGRRDRPQWVERLPAAVESRHPHYRQMTHEQTVDWLATFPAHRRLWADYVLDHAGLCRFVEVLEGLRARDAFAGCLEVVHVLAVRRPRGRPTFAFEAPGPPTDGLKFAVGLYTMVPENRPAALARVTDALRACLDACLESGGRPYLYGWCELDEAARRRVYGADWTRFLELRAAGDPKGVLGPPKV